MYKLLIADDELMICALIKRLVHWEALPVECVGAVIIVALAATAS